MYPLSRTDSRDTDSIQQRQKGELEYLVFPKLEETGVVEHLFTTRTGGVSNGIYSTMNLSFSRGDDLECVRENYRRIGEVLGTDPEHMVASKQTHTTNIHLVTKADAGNGITRPSVYDDIDGLATDIPGIALVTFYADCVPLYFVDPVHRAIGLAHSGWRGTVNRMGEVTLQRMKEAFGTRPSDVWTAIGPSICQDCYEVSEDVAQEFISAFEGWADNRLLYRKENGKYQLNLWRANELVLLESGVPKDRIAVTDICTCCNPQVLFSHRASKGKRGNLGAFLQLLS
mgnify:CR=1 FL=1